MAIAAPIFTTLQSFPGASGQAPSTPPVSNGSHTLYGTLSTGGAGLDGAIYPIDAAKKSGRSFYGTTGSGGAGPGASGTVFKVAE